MLRRAVIQKLKTSVPALGGRVYQAFLAPANVKPPYATVKLATPRGSPNISYAGTQPVEVYLYGSRDSFVSLDILELAVTVALHGVEIEDGQTQEKYYLNWVSGSGDFVDTEKKLIGRMVKFHTALLMEGG